MTKGKAIGAFLAAVAAIAFSATPAMAQAAGDREAIAETLHNYARALDLADPEMYVSVFTEDGGVYDGDTPLAVGHAALAAIVQGVADGRAAAAAAGEPARMTYHLDANPWVEFLSGDHAVQHAYYVTLTQNGGELGLLAAGSSKNEMRKIDGRWLIVRRTILTGP